MLHLSGLLSVFFVQEKLYLKHSQYVRIYCSKIFEFCSKKSLFCFYKYLIIKIAVAFGAPFSLTTQLGIKREAKLS